MCRLLLIVVAALLIFATFAAAQDDVPPKKKLDTKKPLLLFTVPPAVPTDFSGKVRIRGLNLKDIKAISCPFKDIDVKFLKAESVSVPQELDAAKLGDTAVEFEVKLPARLSGGEIPFDVSDEAVIGLLVLDKKNFTILKDDPGNGFRTAMPLELGQTIAGAIEESRDVDVFKLTLVAGRPFVAETLSARRGSPCDPHLTLYDERGRTMLSNDDHAGSRDARLEFTPPADGVYYLSLLEAHDRGHESFRYLLKVEQAK